MAVDDGVQQPTAPPDMTSYVVKAKNGAIGDEAFVRNKLEQFAHQEFNTPRDLRKVGERMRAGLNLTDEPFDRVPEDEADLPAHKPLLERLLRDAAGAAVEARPVDAALAATLRARVRTSASRPPAPRKKKFAVKKR